MKDVNFGLDIERRNRLVPDEEIQRYILEFFVYKEHFCKYHGVDEVQQERQVRIQFPNSRLRSLMFTRICHPFQDTIPEMSRQIDQMNQTRDRPVYDQHHVQGILYQKP